MSDCKLCAWFDRDREEAAKLVIGDCPREILQMVAALVSLDTTTREHADELAAAGYAFKPEEATTRADKYRASVNALVEIWGSPEDETLFHVETYRRAKREAQNHKSAMFCAPCVVFVDSDRFTGMGYVWRDHGEEEPDSLAVQLENGNTWTYPIEHCVRIDDRRQWPEWISKEMAAGR